MKTQAQLEANIDRHLAGHWYWVDMQTPDVDASTAFYAPLFRWETQDMPAGDGVYRMATRGGQTVAAFNKLQQPGVPPHWFAYLTTDDLEASTSKVADLGGTVIEQPFDVLDVGRMSIVQDPTGATFALWQAITHPGSSLRDHHGTFCWAEVNSSDADASLAFFRGLFDYDVQSMEMGPEMTYHVFASSGEQAFGLMQRMSEDVPSHVHVYFQVDDTDAAVAQVGELGGRVLVGPHDIPEVGRSAALVDPVGGVFSVLQPLPRG